MAVQLQGMEEERPFHRALDDAYYTGRILSVMDMETFGIYVSVDYYGLPRNKAEEYRLQMCIRDSYQAATNFLLSEKKFNFGNGQDRYEILEQALGECAGIVKDEQEACLLYTSKQD